MLLQLLTGSDSDRQVKPELEEESEYDQMVREFFNKIAGDDLEIDWMELKQVLDYALKKGEMVLLNM